MNKSILNNWLTNIITVLILKTVDYYLKEKNSPLFNNIISLKMINKKK